MQYSAGVRAERIFFQPGLNLDQIGLIARQYGSQSCWFIDLDYNKHEIRKINMPKEEIKPIKELSEEDKKNIQEYLDYLVKRYTPGGPLYEREGE